MSYDCYCDYDPPSFLCERILKARKEHRCFECRRTIVKGQPYERTAGVWNGSFSTYKICFACRTLREWVSISLPCFCWCYGNMLEDAATTISEACSRAPEEMKGVTFGFLRLLYKVKREPRASA